MRAARHGIRVLYSPPFSKSDMFFSDFVSCLHRLVFSNYNEGCPRRFDNRDEKDTRLELDKVVEVFRPD